MRNGLRLRNELAIVGLGVMLALSPAVRGQAVPAPPAATAPAAVELHRPVFAWYMVCYFSSVDFYKQEIELAQRHGIDGFILDCGAWQNADGTGKLTPTNYVAAAERIYEAARQLNSGFKLFMGPEYSVQPFAANVEDMVRRFQQHPNQFRWQGKVALCGYGPGEGSYREAIERLKKDGIGVCLVPDVHVPRWQYGWTTESVGAMFQNAPTLDGITNFAAKQIGQILSDNATGRRVTQPLGKIFAAGVIPAYNSANLEDYHGLAGYGTMWRSAIADGADWVSIVIWNDFNEDSGLMPFRWPAGQEKAYYDRDESFLEATAFYSAWFKSGQPPAITQDKFFITYRNRAKWNRQAWDAELEKWVDINLTTHYPFDQIHDDVHDLIYLDTFLTAPAKLSVEVGDVRKSFDLPAGVGHAELPLTPGVPRVTLRRPVSGKDTLLADVTGRKLIIGEPTKENSVIGYHLIPRTWASGTAIGPVRRLEAEKGQLGAAATIVQEGGVSAVKNEAQEGSGFTVPIKDLKTSTYNVRIVYCNPSETEARLTLVADGPPRGNNEVPYFIPAFLPPTGKGRFATVSFFWSLYDTTSFLKLEWQGRRDKSPKVSRDDDDQGSVLVDAIELVKVEPTPVPQVKEAAYPTLVAIPGGEFVMGAKKDGEPDEVPLHKVRISPFAIGKYEVTNEEFERFDATHRQFRNGYSWRNREPVIYVSWADAIKYCNWLSRQAGLTAVYQEIDDAATKAKVWQTNLKADGFRLPTEAEWEYVASGRGEGRRYPWGNEPPVPEGQGHFIGEKALDAKLPLPATEAGGVVVVGSYPAGASRDGVMDLAGNVAEWCSDWYNPYTAEEQSDPCSAIPGNHRVIRGGSWGWYNWSQRCADREFNSANYPGHTAYGFRVAISEAGLKKLSK